MGKPVRTPLRVAETRVIQYKGHLENYRPVSLLSLVSKILERCILKRLLVIITPNIHKNQHGFYLGNLAQLTYCRHLMMSV